MIELKSKKTGKVEILSNEEYAKVKDHYIMGRFTATTLNSRILTPGVRIEPKKESIELNKPIKKK